MNGKQLKNSILQWAIQGKLVPQDPNDEPASVLLERIREEKARLVKEKKIKKDKNESIIFRGDDNSHYEKFADGTVKCIDDEIPFEIPQSWCWVRLGSIIDFSKSSSVKPNEIAPDAWILDLEDIEKDTGVLLAKKRMKDIQSKSDKHIFYSGNVLYSKLRPYLNKVIIADENGYCTSEILAFDFGMILNKYAQIYLMSPYFVDYAMSDAYGVKMPRLGSKQGNNALMPLPPFKEQVRIAEQLANIAPIVNRYASSQSELDRLNAELFEKLKKSVLQEAIQGKLVQQDPNDEPASVLLERIKEEKAKLFKEGKLRKKDLVDSVIFKGDDNKYYEKVGSQVTCIDDDIPFDIPSSWSWIRLGNYTEVIGGYAFQSQDLKSENGCRVIRISDISEVGLVNNRIVRYNGKLDLSQYRIYNNDILMAMTGGTVGKSLLLKSDDNEVLLLNQRVAIIRNRWFDVNYIDTVIKSAYIKSIIDNSKNSTNDNISMADITGFIIPIPPLNEQRRIINKLEFVIASITRR